MLFQGFNNGIKKYSNLINYILIPFKLVVLLAFAYLSFSYLNIAFSNSNNVEPLRNYPDDVLDVLVIGSSHAQYSFNPSYFYADTSLYSHNFSSICQPLSASYELLQESIKSQDVKLVILEIYTVLPTLAGCGSETGGIAAQYYLTGENKHRIINKIEYQDSSNYKNKYLHNPFLNNHNKWKDLKSFDSLIDPFESTKYQISHNFGYVYLPRLINYNVWLANTYDEYVDVKISDENMAFLNGIYDLCQENNIELLLYKTPIDSIDIEIQSYFNEVWKWAESKDINYIDFVEKSKELGIYLYYHGDSFHLSINGANIVTTYLSNYIKENYDFTHNNDDKLNTIYQKSYNRDIRLLLKNEVDPLITINKLPKYTDPYIIRYVPDGTNNIDLNIFNLGHLDHSKAHFILIDNNEIVMMSESEINTTYNNSKIIINESGIFINDNSLDLTTNFNLILSDDTFSDLYIKNMIYEDNLWEYGYFYIYPKEIRDKW